MSTNFTTPALYVRSNKYFIPSRRPACGGICLPISPHPLFTFDQTNILYRCGVPPCGGICLPISPHPLFTFDQTNILISLRRPALLKLLNSEALKLSKWAANVGQFR